MANQLLPKLTSLINKRLTIYEGRSIRDLIYTLNRLADGESLDTRMLEDIPLKDLLVQLPETEVAVNHVLEGVENARSLRGYTFVVGDYGTGKTQLSELLIETSSLDNVIKLKVDLGLTSFASFALDLCRVVRQELTENPDVIQTIDSNLLRIEQTRDDAEIYRNIVQILQNLARFNFVFFLHLDEVDMIPNFEAFTPWANFIVLLNQHIQTGVHIVFYMAPRDINRLWDKDARLNRFSRYVSKAISPGKSFGTNVIHAVAQLIAMYEIVNKVKLSPRMLSLISYYLEVFEDRLHSQFLRKVNTDSYQIIEFLDNLQSKDYWINIESSFEDPPLQLKNSVEIAIRQLLIEIPLEMEYADLQYRINYDISNNWFNITQSQEEDLETHVTNIACVVAYSPSEIFTERLADAKYLLTQGPVCLVIIGPPVKEVEQQILENEIASDTNFKLQVLSIPAILAHPLILRSFPGYKSDFSLNRQLLFWFRLISNSKQILQSFFEEIFKKLQESELENQLAELRQHISSLQSESLSIPDIKISPSLINSTELDEGIIASRKDLGDQPSVSEKLTRTEVEILLRIMALFGPRKGKKKENVVREVTSDLKRNNYPNVTEGQILAISNRLVQNGFLKATATQFRKTQLWAPSKIFKSFNLL